MSMVRGWRLIFALGLLAAVLFTAGPRPAAAAGPHISLQNYTYAVIHNSDGSTTTITRFIVNGSGFTPNGAVRISVRGLTDNRVISVQLTKADSSGAFRVSLGGVNACSSGPQEKVVALDGATNTIANFAYPHVCPFL